MSKIEIMPKSAKTSTADLHAEIEDLIGDLRQAREDLQSGPHVLMLVNDLANACDDLFTLEAMLTDAVLPHHRRFLEGFAAYAEDVRATNGGISDAFLHFLETGLLRKVRIAA